MRNLLLSSNFGFTKSGGQSLTNTDTHITRLEKPKLDDNILLSNAWAHHYRIIGNSATCEGDNPYVDESVMCMSVSFTDSNKIRMELYKPDYKPFNDAYDPYVMMKRDSYAATVQPILPVRLWKLPGPLCLCLNTNWMIILFHQII